MITPEPHRSGASLIRLAAPGRRPSLIGVGESPKEIEDTDKQKPRFGSALFTSGNPRNFAGVAGKNPGQEGSRESRVKNAWWILPPIGHLR
jgi:hypothetical protein